MIIIIIKVKNKCGDGCELILEINNNIIIKKLNCFELDV